VGQGVKYRAGWYADILAPARWVGGRLRLTLPGHWLRLLLIVCVLVALPAVFGTQGVPGTALAIAVLWNPTARSVFALLGWFPVNLYVGPGGASDHTAAITSAISAASAAGGSMVVFSNGTYVMTASANGATVPDGIRCVGVGAKSVIKCADSPGAGFGLFGVADAAKVEFESLTLRGPTTFGGASNSVTGILTAAGAFPAEVRCRGVHMIGLSYCIRIGGVTRLLLDDCELDGLNAGATQTTCTGIHIPDNTGGSFVEARGCQFRGFGATDGLSHAFYPYPSVSWLFDDCQFDQSLAGDIFTPHSGTAPSNVPSGKVANCRFSHASTSTSYTGLRTLQYGKTVIVGCTIDAIQGITMQGDTDVIGCDFINVSLPGNGAAITENSGVAALHALVGFNRFYNNNNGDVTAQIAAGSTYSVIGNEFDSASTNSHIGAGSTATKIYSQGNKFRGTAATVDALEHSGTGELNSRNDTFANGRDAFRLGSGATPKLTAIGSEFRQAGASFNYTFGTPSSVYTADCYGSKLDTELATNIVSSATITLPSAGRLFSISSTNTITSITASWRDRVVTLNFTNALTLTDGSNLILAGNFVTTADDTITLVCDGANWREVSRSVN
jgi:hypothetical protein